MSNAVITMEGTVLSFEKSFNAVNAYKLNFKKEANFALQILKGNQFLRTTAKDNPDSLQAAITNIAAIGISLNPAVKEAYLVPRGKMVCLDISYIGLVKLATDTGSIQWVQAEVVKAKDTFQYLGVGKAPVHEMNPFIERGDVIGVYCVAKLSSGECLSTVMSKNDCDAIRDKSSQAAKTGPWKDFYEEMLKKTVIKRASKLWPKSDRLANAVEIINEHEGIEFSSEKSPHTDKISEGVQGPTEKDFKNIRDLLDAKKRSEKELLDYMNTQFGLKDDKLITSIEQFHSAHVDYAYRVIGSMK